MPGSVEPSEGAEPESGGSSVPELAPRLKFAVELAAGYTVKDASRRIGVPYSTCYGWSKTDEVISEVRRLRGASMRRAASVLSEASTSAALTLLEVASNPKASPHARTLAANAILQHSRGIVAEVDVIDRIQALEERGAGK